MWKGGLVGEMEGLGFVEGWLCNRGVWLNIRTAYKKVEGLVSVL